MGQLHARNAVQRPPRFPFKPDVRNLPPPAAHSALIFFCRYVFDNYTWEKTSGDFSSFNDKPIPARVPLTALLSGAPPSLPIYIRAPHQCYSRPYRW